MKKKLPTFDYDAHGKPYGKIRREDPRIATHILHALKDSTTVLNVGAGTGSYEPEDKYVVALEPSSSMRQERMQTGKVPAVNGTAEDLPFDDDSFDSVLASVTVHHWKDMEKGLKEIRRVAKKKVLILTFDPEKLDRFWNIHYFPEVVRTEKERYPNIQWLINQLGGKATLKEIPIPFDCTDGFQEAFYGRPEAFLKQEVRDSQSAWGYIDKETETYYVQRLADDLAKGLWDKKYGNHREMKEFLGSFVLLTVEVE